MLVATVWAIGEKRGDGSVNERREDDGTCSWERSVGGTSNTAGVLSLTGRVGATVACSSPRIWLSFLACLRTFCFSFPSRSFLGVGGDGVDAGDKSGWPKEASKKLGGMRV